MAMQIALIISFRFKSCSSPNPKIISELRLKIVKSWHNFIINSF